MGHGRPRADESAGRDRRARPRAARALNRRLDLVRRVAEHKAETGRARDRRATGGRAARRSGRREPRTALRTGRPDRLLRPARRAQAGAAREQSAGRRRRRGCAQGGRLLARGHRHGPRRHVDRARRAARRASRESSAGMWISGRSRESNVAPLPRRSRTRSRRRARRRRRPGRRAPRRRAAGAGRRRGRATVTDVGSTKRGVAAIEDARFVPGHPLAGGSTGGPPALRPTCSTARHGSSRPRRRAAPSTSRASTRFAESLGAHVTELDAETHDRMLALTSHLPHAIANLLVQDVGDAARTRGRRSAR